MERMSKIKDKNARIIPRKYVVSAAKAGFISGNNLALQFCTKYICKGSGVSLSPAQPGLFQRLWRLLCYPGNKEEIHYR